MGSSAKLHERNHPVNISAKSPTHSELEIGHVLFMDIVGRSKVVIDKQTELTLELNEIVRSSEQFHRARLRKHTR